MLTPKDFFFTWDFKKHYTAEEKDIIYKNPPFKENWQANLPVF